MEENHTENAEFTTAGKQRDSDQANLLDRNQIFCEPSTSRKWLKSRWGEITSNVHTHSEVIHDSLATESNCCDFLRCWWKRRTEESLEVDINEQYIPAVQCERDNLCRYCRIIRKKELTDKRRQLEVCLKLYEKQLKMLNQKEKDLLDKPGKRPSFFRKWGSVFKLSGSTNTISTLNQTPDSNSKLG